MIPLAMDAVAWPASCFSNIGVKPIIKQQANKSDQLIKTLGIYIKLINNKKTLSQLRWITYIKSVKTWAMTAKKKLDKTTIPKDLTESYLVKNPLKLFFFCFEPTAPDAAPPAESSDSMLHSPIDAREQLSP